MTSEGEAKFWGEFGPRRDAMLRRLQKAAGVGKPKPMNLGDLEVIAAASMELLTTALANMPEPRRGELVPLHSDYDSLVWASRRVAGCG